MTTLRRAMLCMAALLCTAIPQAQAEAQTPRETAPVKVQGGSLVGEDRGEIQVFRGIPYAAPPVGALRWAPPQPPLPWSGVRKALKFGASFPQDSRYAGLAGQSEDALFLNVWRPAKAKKAPVFVWFHGGGFIQNSGADPRADGAELAKRGVVVVTLNYRLGALGLFAHPELTAAAKPDEPIGNYVLLDMMQALRWVRANIDRFGGDPRNVTISGSSAGATASLFLMGVRAADGLYDKVIVQSSGGMDNIQTLQQAEAAGLRLAESLKADAPGLEGLRALPATAFALGAQRTLESGIPVKPFVDGRLVKATVAETFASGAQNRVPILMGATNGESGGRGGDDIAAGGAFGFQLRLAEQMARVGQPAWLFQFSFVPPGKPRAAAHGEVVGYLFGTVRSDAQSPGVAQMRDAVMDHWIAFMRNGRPDVPGRPAWPAFGAAGRDVMVFGSEAVSVKPAPQPAATDPARRRGRDARPGPDPAAL